MLKGTAKKIAITLLLVSTALLVPVTSMAAVSDIPDAQQTIEVMPRMTYIVSWKNGLNITGTTATVDCWVDGHVNTATKAKVIAELQVKSGENNWVPVAIWTDTQNDYEAAVYETKTVTEGNTYRVKATFTVWEGSQSETHISIGDERTA